jgi:beta-1,4-mannosyl-glycoprotein beta-1,4-N-acetylglucosaminyltransferase
MVLKSAFRRPVRSAIVAVLLLFATFFLLHGETDHELQQSLFNLGTGALRPLDAQQAPSVCQQHGFKPWRRPGRKVYDLFLFSHELDWLDIRLNTLAPYVDYFVIVEGKTTFTHMPKPAILQDNWSKFSKYHSQMLHHVVEDPIDSARAWDHEDFYRNALLYETFPKFSSSQQASEGDVLIVSDIDEIPKPETMMLLRYCDIPDRLTLRSHFYYYSFQWSHFGVQWPHPQVTTYHGMGNTISPVDLRNGEGGPGFIFLRPLQRWLQKADLWSSTWHCSSCFATIKEMRTKMESFSHTPWNTPYNREKQTIVDRVRNGLDLFGRAGEYYNKTVNNRDVPAYILSNREQYRYLLDRDGEDAAFTDYNNVP